MVGLNLTGTVPVEFASLSHIQEIDLTLNYLSGPIPAVFGQLPLVRLALRGNLISGTIPAEIGNITTMEELVLEDNLLQGNLPQELGSLINLRRLLLSANLIYGTIPDTFRNLRNLTDFRIDGNRISGRIPDFIGNWTYLNRIDMQGMEGPIPDILDRLRNLTSLRIYDLNGTSTSFPNLQGMTLMRELVLRNCSISGPIPEYLVNMSNIRTLDLSYNMLNGQIPSILQSLSRINFMSLAHNSLTGEIPGWILDSRQNFDVSYNNFTSSRDVGCQLFNINVVSSLSSSAGNSVPWCMQPNLPCIGNPNRHSFFINCGGGRTNYEGNEYDENASDQGPSHFESLFDSWAYSSTGTYTGNDRASFIATNVTTMNPTVGDIYRTARLSPFSLKYYGRCLRSGSYRVRLHFAEIMFIRGPNFNSRGRRIFDVAIQWVVVLRDFNIAEAAGGGVGIGIYREFNDVLVNDSTLEIHLYWTGKGTRAIPDRGVYGPLISAIAVTPNFDVGTGLSVGAIIGIAISSCLVIVLLVLVFLWKKWHFGSKDVEDKDIRGLNLQTNYFSLRHIKAATNNFDIANKIGEGGFGPVYKGVMSDGSLIAVKQLSSRSKQGNREFVNEIGMISALQHPNLVKLFGCCIEGNQLLLIYEYLKNNSLARALFGSDERKLNLDWPTRRKICLGIAKGLAFLHEESKLKMVHRDIKATNILLDNDLNAKISDFGLAKLNEEDNTHMSTRVAGTLGYMAPEYAMRGYLTDKADVYSFGIVALEIISGKSINEYRPTEEFVYLPEWASVLLDQGNLSDLVDPNLGSNYSNEEATLMLNLSLLCVNPSHTLRPSMSRVVTMINGETSVHAPIVNHSVHTTEDLNAIEISSDDDEPCIDSLSFLSVKDESQPLGSFYENSTSSLSLKSEGELRNL